MRLDRAPLRIDHAPSVQLIALRDRNPRAYVRERAAALLKIADRIPAAHVARSGLLCSRQEDPVYTWINRFEREGIAGLMIREGHRRKPALSPSAPDQSGRKRRSLTPRAP